MIDRLPMIFAILAWLFPPGFATWAAIELRFHNGSASVPYQVLLVASYGAFIGLFAAGAALYFLRRLKAAAHPISSPHISGMLALAYILLTGLGTVLLLTYK